MNEFPEPSYADRPAPPLPPAEIEAAMREQARRDGVKLYERDLEPDKRNARGPLRDEFKDKDLHPDIPGNPGFDWQSLYERLGELDDVVYPRSYSNEAAQMTAAMLKMLDDWLLDVNMTYTPDPLRAIGLRCIVRVWIVSPERFDDLSLTKLAAKFGFKSPGMFSNLAADFSRKFNLTNRHQRHCRNEKFYENPAASQN